VTRSVRLVVLWSSLFVQTQAVVVISSRKFIEHQAQYVHLKSNEKSGKYNFVVEMDCKIRAHTSDYAWYTVVHIIVVFQIFRMENRQYVIEIFDDVEEYLVSMPALYRSSNRERPACTSNLVE
jgi:hypothetical protein